MLTWLSGVPDIVVLVLFVINFIKLTQNSIMEDSRSVETEAEVDPYEEIVSLGDLNYYYYYYRNRTRSTHIKI